MISSGIERLFICVNGDEKQGGEMVNYYQLECQRK